MLSNKLDICMPSFIDLKFLNVRAMPVDFFEHPKYMPKVPDKMIFVCFFYLILWQETKIFQYCTCPAGRVTYNFHSSCKRMHLSFKSVCNKEHIKGVICKMTSLSNSSQSTHPTGQVLWEELLVLSRFHL